MDTKKLEALAAAEHDSSTRPAADLRYNHYARTHKMNNMEQDNR